jgi:hypothetical integral membrane protein (TIGR02206 family)
MMDSFLVENDRFRPFTAEHLSVVVIGFLAGGLLIWYARRSDESTQVRLGAALAYLILITYFVVFISIDSLRNGFDPKKHLPFAMCNICGATAWLMLHKRNFLAYEVLFFWILSGTLSAVLLPEIKQGFPHYTFFAFWIIHLGLVIAAFYATLVYRMRPTFSSMVKSFVFLNIYAILVGGIDWLLSDYDANYFYVCHKPAVWTPLNLFGEWPYYLLGGELLAAILFVLIFAPFAIGQCLISKSVSAGAETEVSS